MIVFNEDILDNIIARTRGQRPEPNEQLSYVALLSFSMWVACIIAVLVWSLKA